MLNGKNVVIGVCGGIAAYKSLEVISRLKKLNANVDVIMTKSATNFVSPLSFESLSQNPVTVSMFDGIKSWETEHIALAKKADLFCIVPATANIIGKVANGIADDMLSTTIMATKSIVVFAPAMNTAMYENPITQQNIKRLKDYGYYFIEPACGRLACGDTGRGKLADVDTIVDEICFYLWGKKDFSGKRILVTAGPTIEAIDPVRYITNHSSGKMGYAIAEVARNRGADVVLITGPTNILPPRNVDVIKISSNDEMYSAVMNVFKDVDIIIKAAAPADYGIYDYSAQKIKKNEDEMSIKLKKNRDILYELGKLKGDKVLVGFAAESNDIIENAKNKIQKKNLDLIVANDITAEDSGFKSDLNTAFIIDKKGCINALPKMSKIELADIILDNVKNIIVNE